MSDPLVQRRLREAHAQGDAASWTRAAQSLARAARHDEAARALDHAARQGADVGEAREALEPASLDAFRTRRLEAGFLAGRLTAPTFSDDGRMVYTVEDRRTLLRWDLTEGTQARAIELPKGRFRMERITAVGVAPSGGLTLGLSWDEVGWNDPSLLVRVPPGGALPKRAQAENDRNALALSCPHDQLVLVEEAKRVRAYREAGAELVLDWTFTAPQVALGRVVIGVKRGKLLFQEPLADAPFAEVPVEAARRERWALAAARERAVYLQEGGARIALFGPEGRLADAPFTLGRSALVPSPSGRFVAVAHGRTLTLLDLRTGRERGLGFDVRTRRPAWSPGGRRLAVPTDQGALVMVEVPDEASAVPSQVADWIALFKGERFWRARVRGAVIEYRHGRRGCRGRTGTYACDSLEEAERELARRVRTKRRDGYS